MSPSAIADMETAQQQMWLATRASPSRAAAVRIIDDQLAAVYDASWMHPSPPRLLPIERIQVAAAATTAQTTYQQQQQMQPPSQPVVDDVGDPLTGQRALICSSGHGFSTAYQHVASKQLHRTLRVFGWQLLHASIAVGATKVAYVQHGNVQQLLEQTCQNPCCNQPMPVATPAAASQNQLVAVRLSALAGSVTVALQALEASTPADATPATSGQSTTAPATTGITVVAMPPLETLTHAFISCPVAARALAWFQRLWGRLQPEAAFPLTPQVLLQDDCSAFKPPAELQFLWTFLRLLMLHSIWTARCSKAGPAAHTAQAVVSRFVTALQQQVNRDWQRVMTDIRYTAGVPASWFRGRNPAMEVHAFKQKWCVNSVIASVIVVHGAVALAVHVTTAGV